MMNTLRFCLLCLFIMIFSISASAQEFINQDPVSVMCGDIIENEMTLIKEGHNYHIELNAGDIIYANVVPLGEYLKTRIAVQAPDETWFLWSHISGNYQDTQLRPAVQTGVLSARGIYRIHVANSIYNRGHGDNTGTGFYTIYIGCTLRDGTVIEAGNTSQSVVSKSNSPEFSGFGFPGLAPVDMSDVARIPMTAGIPFTGAVTPAGSEILGYAFNATTDQRINLNEERLSGNLNLGVVVIDADSNIIYFSALVTSESMSTRIRMPADGEYMVSVFRLDLLSPDVPEATAFSVQVDMVE